MPCGERGDAIHYEILTPGQRKIWSGLKPSVDLGLVLYGGTAIALYMGHRTSEDFDFFSSRLIATHELEKALPFLKGHGDRVRDTPDTKLYRIKVNGETVKLSFFFGLKIGRIAQPVATDDGTARLASLNDLMATKAAMIFQRSEVRDYLDFARMCRASMDPATGIAGAMALYRDSFHPQDAVQALGWFEGPKFDSLSQEDRAVLIRASASVDLSKLAHLALASRFLTPEEDAP